MPGNQEIVTLLQGLTEKVDDLVENGSGSQHSTNEIEELKKQINELRNTMMKANEEICCRLVKLENGMISHVRQLYNQV